MNARAHARTHARTHAHARTHTHTHTHTHTQQTLTDKYYSNDCDLYPWRLFVSQCGNKITAHTPMHPLTLQLSAHDMFTWSCRHYNPNRLLWPNFYRRPQKARPFCGQNVVAQTHKLEITNTVPHIPDFTADTVKKRLNDCHHGTIHTRGNYLLNITEYAVIFPGPTQYPPAFWQERNKFTTQPLCRCSGSKN